MVLLRRAIFCKFLPIFNRHFPLEDDARAVRYSFSRKIDFNFLVTALEDNVREVRYLISLKFGFNLLVKYLFTLEVAFYQSAKREIEKNF